MAEPITPGEVAHTVVHARHHERSNRREGLIEVGEAVLLAIVAIATAWSGYQTGKWDGRQAHLYGLSSKYRVQADSATTLSGQQRLYDTSTFGFWLQEKASGNEAEAKLFERRFRPEYRPAFRAWLALDPFNNPKAPPGPIFMPQYKNARPSARSRSRARPGRPSKRARRRARKSDKYLRNTVLLATVLFLTALAQKFKVHSVRVGLLVLCGAPARGRALLHRHVSTRVVPGFIHLG